MISGNDWLYLADKVADEYYRVVEPLTEKELTDLVEIHLQRVRYCNSRGIQYIFTIAPNKSTIYPEMLPSWYRPIENKSHLERFAERVQGYPEINFIDMRKDLLELKKRYQIYYITDTHWNELGGFLAYQLITKKIRERFPRVAMIQWSDYTIHQTTMSEGDLSVMLGVGSTLIEPTLTLKYKKIYHAKNVPLDSFYIEKLGGVNPVRLFIMETGNKNLPNAVVFRDSFFLGVTPYLSENFNRVVYFWSPRFDRNMFFDKSIIEHENPDIVITEMVERVVPANLRLIEEKK